MWGQSKKRKEHHEEHKFSPSLLGGHFATINTSHRNVHAIDHTSSRHQFFGIFQQLGIKPVTGRTMLTSSSLGIRPGDATEWTPRDYSERCSNTPRNGSTGCLLSRQLGRKLDSNPNVYRYRWKTTDLQEFQTTLNLTLLCLTPALTSLSVDYLDPFTLTKLFSITLYSALGMWICYNKYDIKKLTSTQLLSYNTTSIYSNETTKLFWIDHLQRPTDTELSCNW